MRQLRGRFTAAAVVLAAGSGWAPAADGPKGPGPIPPAEALKAFTAAPGLAVDLVLSEPEIAQPVFLNFDERGRIWVVEYRQYPEPAGLTMVSRDGVWRAVYDKVPLPPPKGVKGADRVTVHEDTDGDGAVDTHRTFVGGLNIATACARGRGGVWVLNPPYLLFYADRNHDDVPDGDPEVCLEGFGLEDTHAVVNSLRWGPDGWLYAAQGSTVTGRVKRPGTADAPVHSMGQLVWRYHPESRRYEVFAEGGGNAFGVEIDARGRVYSGHNGGDTRGFHYAQGGYYRKGFDKHGPLSNPYAFGYFDAMKHPRVPRFTHTFVLYEADALPPDYRGKLLAVSPLSGHVVLSEIVPDGSTFRTRDVGFPLTTTDRWFRPVDVKVGPDGAVYVADWYDGQVNHYRNHEGQIDRENGRVYRLRAAGARPIKPFNLAARTTDELVDLLADPNPWFRQTALRLIGDRKDASVVPRLLRTLAEDPPGPSALDALWALNLCGGLDDVAAVGLLGHADPHVRLWSARLIGDRRRVSPVAAEALAERARVEPDVSVRSQLASTARRLPGGACLRVVRDLAGRDEDAGDPHVPLLIWWAVESKAETDRAGVVDLFRDRAFWARPVVRRFLTERVMRRYAASGTRKDLVTCSELLALAPTPDDTKRLLAGFEAAYAGRSVAGLPDELAGALARFAGGSVLLGLRQGKAAAVDEALRAVDDEAADKDTRRRYVQVLGEVDQPRAVPVLLRRATSPGDPSLQAAALAALQRYADPGIGAAVVKALPEMTDDVRPAALAVLASRPAWARQLLEAVGAGAVDPKGVPVEVVRRLAGLRDGDVAALVTRHFGDARPATSAELRAEVDRIAARVRAGTGDPRAGEKVFAARCAGCHAIFGKGGNVGPDLTAYRRDDLDTMLLNVVNPGAEVREGYGSVVVATTDGLTLTGVLVDQDPHSVVLRGGDGRDQTVARDRVEAMTPSTASLMPEGLLTGMADKDVRDLFAFLRSTQPPK